MSANRKRGKPLSVCLEDQRDAIKEFENKFSDVNNIPIASNKIYKDISKKLNFRMSCKALYLTVKRNYNYFFPKSDKITKSQEKKTLNCQSHDNVSSDCDEKYSSSSSEYSNNDNINKSTLQVDISKLEELNSQTTFSRSDTEKPNILYHKRNHLPINKWSSIMREIIWDEMRSECTWIFQHNSVNAEGFLIVMVFASNVVRK